MHIKHLGHWLAQIKHSINGIYYVYSYRKDVKQPCSKWFRNLLAKSVKADG